MRTQSLNSIVITDLWRCIARDLKIRGGNIRQVSASPGREGTSQPGNGILRRAADNEITEACCRQPLGVPVGVPRLSTGREEPRSDNLLSITLIRLLLVRQRERWRATRSLQIPGSRLSSWNKLWGRRSRWECAAFPGQNQFHQFHAQVESVAIVSRFKQTV